MRRFRPSRPLAGALGLGGAILIALGVMQFGRVLPWSQATRVAPPSTFGMSLSGPTSGCDQPTEPVGRYERTATDGEGRERTYQIVVPRDYTGKEPLALVFGFHAGGGTSRDPLKYGVVEAAGNRAIIVSPDGIPYKSGGAGWDDTCGGYDVALFDHILADITRAYCIDRTRVFAYGHSWGADFATALACCRGRTLRGIAPNAATDEYSDVGDFRTYANLSCPTRSSAAIRFTHATDGDEAYPAPMFATTAKLYQSFNACPSSASTTRSGMCTTYQGCANPVVECSYPSLGHRIPPDYGRETWTFFEGLR